MSKADEILGIYARIEDSKETYISTRGRAIEECVEWMSCATGGEVYKFADGSEVRIDKDIAYVI